MGSRSDLQPRAEGRIGKCKCGHPQTAHAVTVVLLERADLGRHGKCEKQRCKCRKYNYGGWV